MNYSGINLINGECLEVMQTMNSESVDSIITDPPYGLSFMGQAWDYDVPDVEIWRECLRILKPGGHLLSFAGTRTHHRMAANIEDAGFDIRDMIAWVYGSGFPKSLDIGQAIDRKRHGRDDILRVTAWIKSARNAAGITNADIDSAFGLNGMSGHWTTNASQPAIPTIDQVPALLAVLKNPDIPEDIENLLFELNGKRGEPGANYFKRDIIGTRKTGIGTGKGSTPIMQDSENKDVTAPATDAAKTWDGWGTALKPAIEPITMARKPFAGTTSDNVIKNGTGALNIKGCRIGDEIRTNKAAANKPGGNSYNMSKSGMPQNIEGRRTSGRWPANLIHDGSQDVVNNLPCDEEGSFTRLFYCAKTQSTDRGAENIHPTVKPVYLMCYLCRLVTPPGGLVLDPFMGSGSTGKAAMLEGFGFIGIEMESAYVEIAESRLEESRDMFSAPVFVKMKNE